MRGNSAGCISGFSLCVTDVSATTRLFSDSCTLTVCFGICVKVDTGTQRQVRGCSEFSAVA